MQLLEGPPLFLPPWPPLSAVMAQSASVTLPPPPPAACQLSSGLGASSRGSGNSSNAAATPAPTPQPQPCAKACNTGSSAGSDSTAAVRPAAAAAMAAAGAAPMPYPNLDGWLASLIQTSANGSFFAPCPAHADLKKCEATHFCIDCGAGALCQHCLPAHAAAGHRTLQVRRYVYCDVVRAADVAPFVDASGVCLYTINQAKAVFLRPRAGARPPPPGGPQRGCGACGRALRDGCAFCSLACRVAALARGGALGPASAAAAVCAGACGIGCGAAVASPPALAAAAACAQPVSPLAPLQAAQPATSSGAASDASETAAAVNAGAVLPLPALAPLRAPCGGAAADDATWAGRRASDDSCSSHLAWHDANGHVCRRKQASPRRSPLL